MDTAKIIIVKNNWSLIRTWAEMIKIEHTVFALPFALSGLILGTKSAINFTVVFWAIIAFTCARAAAMTLNRLLDAKFDALNPRTSQRAIPRGIISSQQALYISIVSFAVMIFAASRLPILCLWLSPIAVFWLTFYSYTKRFTWLCHFALGIALGGAAVGGWVASAGEINGLAPWLLAAAVTTWVAGFDIIYACQDIDFDCEQKLFSIPAKFGVANALVCSTILHVITVFMLVACGLSLGLGAIYWIGVVLVTIMLIFEHWLVKPNDLTHINAAFFNINGCISIAMFIAILLDKIT